MESVTAVVVAVVTVPGSGRSVGEGAWWEEGGVAAGALTIQGRKREGVHGLLAG